MSVSFALNRMELKMFKITKGSVSDTYTIECYFYIRGTNFYSFLYSAKNISFDILANLLQGRLKYTDDLKWIVPIVSLTNQPAIIGEDGVLRAVPVGSEKETNRGSERKTQTG